MCLRIFLRRFLITLPTVSPHLVCLNSEHSRFQFVFQVPGPTGTCIRSVQEKNSNAYRTPREHPRKWSLDDRPRREFRSRTASSQTSRPGEREGVLSLSGQVNPSDLPRGRALRMRCRALFAPARRHRITASHSPGGPNQRGSCSGKKKCLHGPEFDSKNGIRPRSIQIRKRARSSSRRFHGPLGGPIKSVAAPRAPFTPR